MAISEHFQFPLRTKWASMTINSLTNTKNEYYSSFNLCSSPPEKTVPSIPQVQSMIEEAWKEGLDPQGASHFNQRLQGTRAWIGATEIYSLLTSLGIRWVTLHPVSVLKPLVASCNMRSWAGKMNNILTLVQSVKSCFSPAILNDVTLPKCLELWL